MSDLYNPCRLCPRLCGADRRAGKTGFCGESAALRIGAAVIHRGEEPPLVGKGGSGTIFVSGCGLGCVFCQNYQISQGAHEQHGEAMRMNNAQWRSPNEIPSDNKSGFALANLTGGAEGGMALGKEVSTETFTAICAALHGKGAENINIVTGSHAVPAIVDGICAARRAGIDLPVLWNSSAYENLETLELLRGHVDIFLPDLKTLDSGIAAMYFYAPDYPAVAKAAILKMIEMLGENTREKLIIRHLILPGHLESTRQVLRWFADNAKDRALLSLMTQYCPTKLDYVTKLDKPISGRDISSRKRPMPKRCLNEEEYETVLSFLDDFGIEDGFCQELVTGSDWLPDFRRQNPFSSELSVPIWPL